MAWYDNKGFFESLEESIDDAIDPCRMRDFYKGAPYNPYDFSFASAERSTSNGSSDSYWDNQFRPYDF